MASDSRPLVSSLRGIVAAAHPLAATAGARMLRDGGNAFDAVVATAAALNVVEPFMSGLAGLGMATCYVSGEHRVRALDFVPGVPLEFNPARRTHDEIDWGPLASAVPGSLAGWCKLAAELGTLPLPRLFAPAIELAEEGPGHLYGGALGRRLDVESRIDDPVREGLDTRGHAVHVLEPFTRKVGGFHGIHRDPQTGALAGAADPRRDGHVAPA